jgi:hypothetical protein
VKLFTDGAGYTGEFWRGLQQGVGKAFYENKETYEGEFFDDYEHGKGTHR